MCFLLLFLFWWHVDIKYLIIVFIMIKSSNKEFNNSYRILRVLQNQDYLAIDSTRNQFIFCQLLSNNLDVVSLPSITPVKSLQNELDCIKFHNESVTVDGIKYLVFDVGRAEVIWAANIDIRTLKQPKFLFNLVKQAFINILGRILWMEPKYIKSILTIRNFLILKGHLHFLLMPRIKINHLSLKRNEKRRSNSNQCAIHSIIAKQQKVIRYFAEIILQIVQKKQVQLEEDYQLNIIVKQLLTRIISTGLSYQQIQQQITIIGEQILGKSTNNAPLHRIKQKQTIFHRQYTMNKRSISHYSTQKYQQKNQISQNHLDKYKTQIINSHSNEKTLQSTLPRSKSKFQSLDENQLSKKNRSNSLSYSRKSGCLVDSNIKINHSIISILNFKKKNSHKFGQRYKLKYVNWIKEAKIQKQQNSPLKQKIQYQSKVAKNKFAQNIQQGVKSQNQSNNFEQKLKDRLIQKINRLRHRKYQNNNYTQPVKQNVLQVSVARLNGQSQPIFNQKQQLRLQCQSIVLDKQIDQNNHIINKVDIQIKQLKLPQDLKQQLSNQHQTVQKQQYSCIQDMHGISIEAVDKLATNLDINHPLNQIHDKSQDKKQNQKYSGASQHISYNSINNSLHSDIEQLKLQQRPNKKDNQISKHIKNSKLDTDKHQSNFKLKQIKKSKIIMQDSKFQDIQEIQMFTLRHPLEPHKQTSYNQQNKIQQKIQIKTMESNKASQKLVEQFQLGKDKNKNSNSKICEQVIQYLNMINILGDITVSTIKNKQFLKDIQWRKPAFLLYERFYYQRTLFVKRIKAKNHDIIRKHQRDITNAWNNWEESEQREKLIQMVTNQNVKIAQTFQKFTKKVLKQSKLQLSIIHFIKNRDSIIQKNIKDYRQALSKFAAALIINQYDKIIQKKLSNKIIINYISDCIFGLQILIQLDGLSLKRQPLNIQHYKQGIRDQKYLQYLVEQIYDIYYPQTGEKQPN